MSTGDRPYWVPWQEYHYPYQVYPDTICPHRYPCETPTWTIPTVVEYEDDSQKVRKTTIRQILRLTQRIIDKHGHALLIPETDIEGATWFHGRIFWITSHGRNRDGKYWYSRNQFFATTVTLDGDELNVTVDGNYTKLLDDLIAYDSVYNICLADAIGAEANVPLPFMLEDLEKLDVKKVNIQRAENHGNPVNHIQDQHDCDNCIYRRKGGLDQLNHFMAPSVLLLVFLEEVFHGL